MFNTFTSFIPVYKNINSKTAENFKLSRRYMNNISVGIDLGTTFSLISVIDLRNISNNNPYPKIIPIDCQRMLPSVVSYEKEGKILVGYEAINQEFNNNMNTFSSVKRIIGKTFQKVKLEKEKSLDLKIAYSKSIPNSLCELFVPSLQSKVSPEKISSEILKKLLQSAKEYLGESYHIDKAVITVPAYFRFNCCS